MVWVSVNNTPARSRTEAIWIKDREQEQQWSMRSPLFAATFCSPQTLFHDPHVDQLDIVSGISSISEQALYTQASTIPATNCLVCIWRQGLLHRTLAAYPWSKHQLYISTTFDNIRYFQYWSLFFQRNRVRNGRDSKQTNQHRPLAEPLGHR